MTLISRLEEIWRGETSPFLVTKQGGLAFADIAQAAPSCISQLQAGDVVALIGDFEPVSIASLLALVEVGAVVVPLTKETRADHEYFFEAAHVRWVLEAGILTERAGFDSAGARHPMLEQLRAKGSPGLVLFSSGTTGRPKAILHDFSMFLRRYSTPRPTLRTLNFLLFDHIGGINTLLHTLFNRGLVIALEERTVASVLAACRMHCVELLPTTPTFLRLMLISGLVPAHVPESLKIITYGTERMDQPTLDQLTRLLPNIDFRQTFGMSELGIVRVRSKARDSLYMSVGGEGVETKVTEEGLLLIRSESRMIGYLNAPSPFDADGWYNTGDLVDVDTDGYMRVTGRKGDTINVGGLKFLPAEVERAALAFNGAAHAVARGRANPITGQHVELTVEWQDTVADTEAALEAMKAHLRGKLPPHMMPRRITVAPIGIGHRFKKI